MKEKVSTRVKENTWTDKRVKKYIYFKIQIKTYLNNIWWEKGNKYLIPKEENAVDPKD